MPTRRPRGWKDGGPTRWWQWPWRGLVTWWNLHRALNAEREWVRRHEPHRWAAAVWGGAPPMTMAPRPVPRERWLDDARPRQLD